MQYLDFTVHIFFFLTQLYWGITDIQKYCTHLMYTIWWVWTYAYTCETMTTITTINIPLTSQSFLYLPLFCVLITLNVRPALLNFVSAQTALLTIGTVSYGRSRAYPSCMTELLYPLNNCPLELSTFEMCILFDPSNSISKNPSYGNSVHIQSICKNICCGIFVITWFGETT